MKKLNLQEVKGWTVAGGEMRREAKPKRYWLFL